MDTPLLLRKLELLEQQLNEVKAENVQLKIENAQHVATIKQLEDTLKQYADGKLSKKPKFGLVDCEQNIGVFDLDQFEGKMKKSRERLRKI